MKNKLKSKKGQGLIEYLILVATIAVVTMGVVRVMGHSLQNQFARVTGALNGRTNSRAKSQRVDDKYFSQKDLSNFDRHIKTKSK